MKHANCLKALMGTIAISILSIASAWAQTATSSALIEEWIRIVSPSGDISVDIPSHGMIVDNDDSEYSVYTYRKDIQVSISMEPMSGAKARFRQWASIEKNNGRYSYFEKGDFLVKQLDENIDPLKEKEVAGRNYIWLYLASSKGSYTVSVSSPGSGSEIFSTVIKSLRLKGVPLYKESTSKFDRQASINTLETTSIVRDALSRPDSRQSELIKPAMIEKSVDTNTIVYSRSLIILRKHRAEYTDKARRKNIRGSVKLRVTFLANGEIGPIELIESLDTGLDKAALIAVRKWKFLPAEVDGKAIEITRPVTVGFNIY